MCSNHPLSAKEKFPSPNREKTDEQHAVPVSFHQLVPRKCAKQKPTCTYSKAKKILPSLDEVAMDQEVEEGGSRRDKGPDSALHLRGRRKDGTLPENVPGDVVLLAV